MTITARGRVVFGGGYINPIVFRRTTFLICYPLYKVQNKICKLIPAEIEASERLESIAFGKLKTPLFRTGVEVEEL